MVTFKKLILDSWFPTVIGIVDCPFFNLNKKKYLNYILKIKKNEGFNNYQIHLDKNFKELNDWITKEVNNYATQHNFFYEYEPKESWFIDYKKYESNEWHCHIGYTISTVFIIEGKPGEVYTRFKNSITDQKNPQNHMVKDNYKNNFYNQYTFPSCQYDTIPGRLLIFRSYVIHSSDQLLSDNKRIILSHNFDPK